jgi:hypothetical protein
MSAATNSSPQIQDKANKDQLAPVAFFDFSMHHIMKNPRWRMHMRMMLRREDRMEDRLEDLTDAKSAMAIQRAMLLKLSTAHEWQRWQADQTVFRNVRHRDEPLKLDAQRVERLGVSFLEKRAFEAAQTRKLPTRDESGFVAQVNEWVNELSSEVMLLLSAGDRQGLWSLQDVHDAPEGQMVAGSQYWKTRAAISLDAACSPGAVLSRFVESQEPGVLGHRVTLNVGNIFTTSTNTATIAVHDLLDSASDQAGLRGGSKIAGMTGVLFSLRAMYGLEDGLLIKGYHGAQDSVSHVVREMRECALHGPAPEILLAESLDSVVRDLHFFEPDVSSATDQSVDDELADFAHISQGLRSLAFNHSLTDDEAQRFKNALDAVGRDVYVDPTCVDPSIDMTGAEEALLQLGNILSMARNTLEASQAVAPSAKEDLLGYIAESKTEQSHTM